MVESLATGKTRRTNMSVYSALGFMGSGLIASALIVIYAGHGFGRFLAYFLKILSRWSGVIVPLCISPLNPVDFFDLSIILNFSLLHST